MSDATDRLIETAVRPIDDNAELKMASAAELAKMARDETAAAEAAIRRWDQVDARRRKPIWRIVLFALLIAATALVATRDSREVVRYWKWRKWVGGSYASEMPKLDERVSESLTAKQRLILFADPDDPEDLKNLCRVEPDNPAYFAQYASSYVRRRHSLPPDYDIVVKRLAPDNAWFTYLAAAVEGEKAVEQTVDSSGAEDWKILDESRLGRAMALLRKATDQPAFDSYDAAQYRECLALLPANNTIERVDAIAVLSSRIRNSIFNFIVIQRILAGKAWMAGNDRDPGEFREVSEIAGHFLRNLTRSVPTTLLDGVIAKAYVKTIAKGMASAAEKLALPEEQEMWDRVLVRVNRMKNTDLFRIPGRVEDPGLIAGRLFGFSLDVGMKVTRNQPRLTDADLKPGRMLDHEILSRFCGYVIWCAMGLCLAAVAGYRFRVSMLGRKLAVRFGELLDGGDWLWILGAGVMSPFLYVMAVNRLTPLGGRDFGMAGTAWLLPAGQFLGLLTLWLVAPAQIARWRLSKRVKVFGFPRAPRIGWVALTCAAAFVPLIGWAGVSRSFPGFWQSWMEKLDINSLEPGAGPERFWLAMVFLGIPLFWVTFAALRALLDRSRHLIFHATVARTLVPASAAAMLMIALATMAFKASERHWFERENLGKLDPAKPGWSAFEYDIALQMRRELRDSLGGEPGN